MSGGYIDYGTFITYRMWSFSLYKFHFRPALKIDKRCLIGSIIHAVGSVSSGLLFLCNNGTF